MNTLAEFPWGEVVTLREAVAKKHPELGDLVCEFVSAKVDSKFG